MANCHSGDWRFTAWIENIQEECCVNYANICVNYAKNDLWDVSLVDYRSVIRFAYQGKRVDGGAPVQPKLNPIKRICVNSIETQDNAQHYDTTYEDNL